MAANPEQLLREVATRQRLQSMGRWACRFALIGAGVYALVLLAARLLGLLPDVFEPLTVLIIPALAVAAAVIVHQRADALSAARAVDRATASKDLFLTSAMLDRSPGEYRPLVAEQAVARSAGVRSGTVVPFDWMPGAGRVGAALAALALATLLLPQLDPFGAQEKQRELAKRKTELEKAVQKAEARAEVLRAAPLDADHSKQVNDALERLKQTFNQMKPDQPKANVDRLNEQQKEIGENWRRASEKQMRNASRVDGAQRLRSVDRKKAEQWKKDLAEGKTDGLKQELAELAELAKELQDTNDQAQKQQLQQQLQQRLSAMQSFAQQNMSSPELNSALQQAMEQLQMASQDGMSQQAMAALQSSLQLSELEMQQMAQTLRDMQAMEQALQSIQMAKQLNSMQPLDGAQCKQCQGMGDYMKLYAQMISQCQGEGQGRGLYGMYMVGGKGSGMGGPGQGEGNIAPEDESITTGFQPEKSRSAITAGRMLLEWKVQEDAKAGEVNQQYAEALDQVKQGVSEAVLQERVPPGYHDAIKRYFDTIDQPEQPAPASP